MRVEFVDEVGAHRAVSLEGARHNKEGFLAYFRLHRKLALMDMRELAGTYDLIALRRIRLTPDWLTPGLVSMKVYGEVWRACD